jgi:hypothetical protein
VQTVRQLGGTLGVAIIGAIVLGMEHRGGHPATARHAADGITLGFAFAAATFARALAAGWLLLSRASVTAGVGDPGEALAHAAR